MENIKNPILKGFNPDPSILRVGDDYYIATSTFEWYPGVQIHHSRDLKNWKLVAHPLNRNSQLNMAGEKNSGGVWAPCLSYSNGTYFLVYTDMKHLGISHNYVVTTTNILGDWSEPVFLDGKGFDPSMFHDDDGKKWYTVTLFDQLPWNYLHGNILWSDQINGRDEVNHTQEKIYSDYAKLGRKTPLFKGIMLQEYSEKEKMLIGEPKVIFGNEIGSTEAPHLYKRGEYYYLIVAEGGTSFEHCVTMARSKNIEGPYEVHPQNPIIRALGTDAYLQKTGHADLVETQNGETYMVFLCGRPINGKKNGECILGRETAIQKMKWGEDGWLRLACGGSVAPKETPAPELEEFMFPKEPARDNFDLKELNINFQWLRHNIKDEILSLSARPGFLRLYGKEIVTSYYTLSLVARRQQSFNYDASTCMEFQPYETNQMAGLIVFYSNELHYYLNMSWDPNIGSYISIMVNNNKEISLLDCEPIPVDSNKPVYFKAEVRGENLQFYYGTSEFSYRKIGSVYDMTRLSDEYSGGFTGAFVGLCCNDPSSRRHYADFDYFEYQEK